MNKEATQMSGRFGKDITDSEAAQLAEFQYIQKSAEPIKVLHHATVMVRKGIRDVGLYETAIRLSVEMRRKPSVILQLIEDAGRAFPGKAKGFASLAPNLDPSEDDPDGDGDEIDDRSKSG
jgi:hypothetical protein